MTTTPQSAVWALLLCSTVSCGLVVCDPALAQIRFRHHLVDRALPTSSGEQNAAGTAADATPKPPAARWLPVDPEGWSILRPAKDSRLVYVSSSKGDDNSARFYTPGDPVIGPDPFHPTGQVRPYKTIRAALAVVRDEHPDWLLLKRGDTWTEAIGPVPNGRSKREPFVVASYGSNGPRPQLRLDGGRAGVRLASRNGFHDVAIVGLEFYVPRKDPRSAQFTTDCAAKPAIWVYLSGKRPAAGRRLLVEDCCLRFCGVVLQVTRERRGEKPPAIAEIVFRRNLVLDNYSRTSHCQGTFAAGISMLLEENVYDHNGWLIQERGNRKARGGATMFNHNTYFADCHDVVFRNNLFLRASSAGNKWTANSGPGSASNLVMENNLYVEGEIGIGIGGNTPGPLRFRNVRITNNVLIDMGRGRPTLRTLGWGVDVTDWDGGLIAGNVFVQPVRPGVRNVHLLSLGASDATGKCRNVTVKDNVFCGGPVYLIKNADRLNDVTLTGNRFLMPWAQGPLIRAAGDLSGCKFSNNVYWSTQPADKWFQLDGQPADFATWVRRSGETGSARQTVPVPQPVPTIESYMAHLGLKPTLEAFVAEVRKQSRTNWRPQFTAAAVNNWVRKAFRLAPNQ